MSHIHKMGLSSPSSGSIIPVSGSNHHSLGKTPVSVLQPSLLTANNQNRNTSLHAVLNVGSVQLPGPGSNVSLSKPLLHRNVVVTLPDSASTSSTTMVTSILSNKTGSDVSTTMSAARKRSTTNAGTKGRGKTLLANPSTATDLDMGCMGQQSALNRKNSRSAIAGHAPPASVARRNARERNRVKQVNNGFASLRQHIPLQVLLSMASESGNSSPTATSQGGKKNKISKVDTLRCAVEYIRSLEQILSDTDPENTEPHMVSNSPMIKSEWMSTCGSPNGMNGALMHGDGLHSQHLYHGESSAEELIDTSSEFNEEPYGCDEENISPGNSISRHLKLEHNNDDATLFQPFTFEEAHHDQHMHQAAVAEAEYAMQTATLAMAPNDRKGHLHASPQQQQHLFPTAQTLPSLNRAFPGRALGFMLPQQEQALLFHSKDKQNEDPNSSQDEDLDSTGSHSGSADSANLLIDSWWLIPSM